MKMILEEKMNQKFAFVCILLIISILSTILLIFPRLRYKEAISIVIEDGNANIEEYVGKKVRLLCRTAQMSGVWFVALSVEENSNVFRKSGDLIYGQDLYVSGEDPFDCLKETLTIYANNLFVLEGELSYDATNEWGPGYSLIIQKWDIVYPVDTQPFRFIFFQRHIYLFDLR